MATSVLSAEPTEEGGITSRLKMWEQTLHIGLNNPFGTGAGSFRNTIHAFQEYPLIGFSSAHNVFLEVFSTGGWPRLIVLVLLLAFTLLRRWRGQRWPVAVGSAGIWATMCFDITYQMPGIMTIAFWSLGTCLGETAEALDGSRVKTGIRSGLAVAALAASGAAAVWWYTPCNDVDCILGRHLGYRAEVLELSRSLDSMESRRLAERAVELNPQSLWAWRLRADQAAGPMERLEANRELTCKFPLMAPENYLRWADAAIDAGSPAEARNAILAGLAVFPPGFSPAGVPMGGRAASYQNWLEEAAEILQATQSLQ